MILWWLRWWLGRRKEWNKFWKFVLVIELVVLDVGLDKSLNGSDKVWMGCCWKVRFLTWALRWMVSFFATGRTYSWKQELSSQGLFVNVWILNSSGPLPQTWGSVKFSLLPLKQRRFWLAAEAANGWFIYPRFWLALSAILEVCLKT